MKHVLRTLFPILVGGAILAGCGQAVVPDQTAEPAAGRPRRSARPPRSVDRQSSHRAAARAGERRAAWLDRRRAGPRRGGHRAVCTVDAEEWEAALAQFGGPQATASSMGCRPRSRSPSSRATSWASRCITCGRPRCRRTMRTICSSTCMVGHMSLVAARRARRSCGHRRRRRDPVVSSTTACRRTTRSRPPSTTWLPSGSIC